MGTSRRHPSSADVLLQDLRYGMRLLARNPLFTLTAALSLTIGIGATTTIFSIANGLLLRAPAGIAEPDRLVDVVATEEGRFGIIPSSYADYREIRQRAASFDDVYACQLEVEPLSLRVDGGAERIFGTFVSTNYFHVLGVRTAAGRSFSAADGEQPGAVPLAVLSHRFWTRRFAADPSVVGRVLRLNGEAFTVVGVAQQGFQGSTITAPDIWLPIPMVGTVKSGTPRLNERDAWLMLGARLKTGVGERQAETEIDAIGRALDSDRPKREIIVPEGTRSLSGRTGLRLAPSSPIPSGLRLIVAGFLGLLLGIVAVVLIIACANLAGVLLARGATRRREIAVRVAIGAGRRRLVRQLLTETTLLFAIGGAGGLLLARLLTSLVLVLLPAFPVPIELSLPLDGRVIAFAIGLSFVAALLSGLAPALHASKADVVSALKDDALAPADRMRLRNAFVIGQVAFSVVLVISAGLLVRALHRVTATDVGFDPRGVETAALDLSLARYTKETGPAFARELAARVRALPGVEQATLASAAPTGAMRGMLLRVSVPGVAPADGQPFFHVLSDVVDTNYFETMRIPLLGGRGFNESDRAGSQPVAIVSESTARRLWPGQDPVGKHLLVHPNLFAPGTRPAPTAVIVAGVAADLKRRGATSDRSALAMYLPLQQRYVSSLTILARARPGYRLTGDIRTLVTAMDPNLPILSAQPLEDQMTGPVELQLRVAASVSGTVGIIGLLLAAIGIYGVTAYIVTRRTREIGVRIALGAQPADVIRLVLRQGLALMAIGGAIGLGLGAIASRLLTRLLFGLPPIDPVTFGGTALVFAAIGLVACYVPVRRATRITAIEALRYE